MTEPPVRDSPVEMAFGSRVLSGRLQVPEHPRGLVVVVPGAGSGRHCPRNRYIARMLNRAGLGTLRVDLIADAERGRRSPFGIEPLAERLAAVTAWVREYAGCSDLPIGYLGSGTGAAVALVASTVAGMDVGGIVSRVGRPDLAMSRLAAVTAPTLLIVPGGPDDVVRELNRGAQAMLSCETRLAVIPPALDPRVESVDLDQEADLACDWFARHLSSPADAAAGGGRGRP